MHLLLLTPALLLTACAGPEPPSNAQPATTVALPAEDPTITAARKTMVARQLAARDIDDPRVLDAMARVPRHRFVPMTGAGSR